MIKWLLHLFVSIFHRKASKTKSRSKKQYASQRVTVPYALAALSFFGIQGIVATAGAIGLVFPDLPTPISFELGRAMHLNFSVYWPLIGSMGLVYYFFIKEAETELHSTLVAQVQFWIILFTTLGIISSLALGLTNGREYREAVWPFQLGITISIALFAYNLLRTYKKSPAAHGRVVLLAMLSGAISLLILDLPNIISYVHPTTDEVVRFWVVHMWEELSKELLVFGAYAALIMDLTGTRLHSIEKALYIQTILLIIGATFATGHHYYWVGTPAIWLLIGVVFSVIQIMAIFMLLYITYKGYKNINWARLHSSTKLALGFIFSSVVYHIAGAAVMGMTISIPRINRYSHGTYLTSSHSHLALFGAIGMFVLGGCTYILTERVQFSKLQLKLGWLGMLLINTGLAVMSFCLLIAGLLQSYLGRMAGGNFTDVDSLLRPYLIIRAGGGALFASGGILYVSLHIILTWKNRSVIFSKKV